MSYRHHHGGGFGTFVFGFVVGIAVFWIAPEAVKGVVGSAAAAGVEILGKMVN